MKYIYRGIVLFFVLLYSIVAGVGLIALVFIIMCVLWVITLGSKKKNIFD